MTNLKLQISGIRLRIRSKLQTSMTEIECLNGIIKKWTLLKNKMRVHLIFHHYSTKTLKRLQPRD